MRLFSEMNKEELQREIKRLKAELEREQKKGLSSKQEILRQQINIAKSYLRDPKKIEPGRKYRVEEFDKPFFVKYLRGIMAWGHWEGEVESIALPIGILKPDEP